MADVKLNFINKSNDRNNSEIVIFQKNVAATSYDEIAVAWKVIENCGQGWVHPFVYPMSMLVAASDSWGNLSGKLPAQNGQTFQVTNNGSGDVLQFCPQHAGSVSEVDVLNSLAMGAIDANIYKDGRLLATKTGIAPGQKAVFEFKPSIYIGVVSEVQEGDIMNSAIISQVNTELNLLGVASADIVMTGGAPGPNSTSFVFALQNVVYA